MHPFSQGVPLLLTVPLSPEEEILIQAHPALESLLASTIDVQRPAAKGFLQTLRELFRTHDGTHLHVHRPGVWLPRQN